MGPCRSPTLQRTSHAPGHSLGLGRCDRAGRPGRPRGRTAGARRLVVALACRFAVEQRPARRHDLRASTTPTSGRSTRATEFEAVTLQYDMLMKFSRRRPHRRAPGHRHRMRPPAPTARVWTCTDPPRPEVERRCPAHLEGHRVHLPVRRSPSRSPYFSGYFPEGTTFETPERHHPHLADARAHQRPDRPGLGVHRSRARLGEVRRHADVKEITVASVAPEACASGPYIDDRGRRRDRTGRSSRNPHFWGDKPAYHTIVFQLFTNQEAMVQALKNGQIDIADGLEPALLPAVETRCPTSRSRRSSPTSGSTWRSTSAVGRGVQAAPRPQGPSVRKAIEMAIDKQKIVDTVYPGAASPGRDDHPPAVGLLAPRHPRRQGRALRPRRGQRAARPGRLREGRRRCPRRSEDRSAVGDPACPPPTTPPAAPRSASSSPASSSQVGITVKVQPVTAGKMYDLQQSGDFDAYIWYWSGDPDPNYQLSVFASATCPDLSDGCWLRPDVRRDVRAAADDPRPDRAAPDRQRHAAVRLRPASPGSWSPTPTRIEAYRHRPRRGPRRPTPAKIRLPDAVLHLHEHGHRHIPPGVGRGSASSSSSAASPSWAWVVGVRGRGWSPSSLVLRRRWSPRRRAGPTCPVDEAPLHRAARWAGRC